MFSQTENPYRNPPKLESKPIPEVSSAELKAKAVLLEMLGRENPEVIRRWVMENSYEESLLKDETVFHMSVRG